MENQERGEVLVQLVHLDLQGQRAREEIQETEDRTEEKEFRGFVVTMDSQGCQGHRGHWVLPVHLDFREFQGLREIRGHQVVLVLRVP